MDNYEGIVLSLGSNIGNRKKNLVAALIELSKIGEIKNVSSVYESEALLLTDQRSFYNIAIEIKYSKNAYDLLTEIKKIELNLGRKKTVRYGPRIIDIDIIDFEGLVLKDKLYLPHVRMHERNFVLFPLFEIEKEWVHPIKKVNIKKLIFSLPNNDIRSIKQI